MNVKQIRIPAIFICLIFTTSGFSYAGEIRIGAHAGICIPNIRGPQGDLFTEGFASRQGPFLGIMAEMGLAPHFSLAAEVNYTSQGGKKNGLQIITPSLLPSGLPIPSGMALFADFSNESILDYIEVPLLARLTFGSRIRCYVNAGPYAGFLVRARARTQGTSAFYLDKKGTMPIVIPPSTTPLQVDMTANTDVRNSLKDTNFGVCGGAGVLFPAGPGELAIDARFQLGLTIVQRDIQKTGEGRIGAIIISIGYVLPLKR